MFTHSRKHHTHTHKLKHTRHTHTNTCTPGTQASTSLHMHTMADTHSDTYIQTKTTAHNRQITFLYSFQFLFDTLSSTHSLTRLLGRREPDGPTRRRCEVCFWAEPCSRGAAPHQSNATGRSFALLSLPVAPAGWLPGSWVLGC